jgi:ubiquinone/menaquinone biosynthesis C-methylase UbiE
MQKSIDEIYRVLKPNGKIIIMIYNKYSLVGLQLYLFYGLAKMRLFSNLNRLYYTHHESEGTKAFTDHETMIMFKSFHNTTIKNIVTPYDLRISRNKFLPKFFSFLVPSYLGFFKVIIGYKQ